MRLSAKSRYAVMGMIDIARNESGAPLPLSAIAERQQLSLFYLEQLFSKLRQAGLVKSLRGSQGGYILGKPANEIFLFDMIAAVDETLKATRCRDENVGCLPYNVRCEAHNLWAFLTVRINDFFKKISLHEISCNHSLTTAMCPHYV